MIPRMLKHFNLFVDGRGYAGRVMEIELPELSIKTEEHRGGGMDIPVDIDMGMELLSCSVMMSEYNEEQFVLFGLNGLTDVPVTLRGGLRAETQDVMPVVINLRGRWKKLELGTWKGGEKTETKFELTCTYFRYVQGGRELIEIDAVNMVRRIDGTDQLADMRAAIGL